MIPRSRSIAAALVASGLVAGCATNTPGPYGPLHQTPIPQDSTLVLEQSLDVPARRARVFMQDGRVVRDSLVSAIDRFKPHCSFGLERKGSESLVSTIEADRFGIGPVRTYAVARHWPEEGVKVAGTSLSSGIHLARGGRGSPDTLTYVLEVPLSSSSQPQVDDLTCKVDWPLNWNGELGLESFNEAVGEIVRIERAE